MRRARATPGRHLAWLPGSVLGFSLWDLIIMASMTFALLARQQSIENNPCFSLSLFHHGCFLQAVEIREYASLEEAQEGFVVLLLALNSAWNA